MRAIAYYRVSTKRQGESGLGLESQQAQVQSYLAGSPYDLAGEYVEVESGRKSDKKRPQLRAALAQCEASGAVLVIAKLDRLTRNLAFLTTLLERKVSLVALDVPQMQDPAMNRFMLQLMANLAELEREKISQRTCAALGAVRARGTVLGSPAPEKGAAAGGQATAQAAREFAREVHPVIQELREYGCQTLAKIAQGLTARGVKTFRGAATWSASSVRNVLMNSEVTA
jgi:DNA invertase Pin-like site-specific DNA recombinase